MFEDLRRAFSDAVDNFNRELNRDEPLDGPGRHLKGMSDRLSEARSRVARLGDEVASALAEAEREAAEVATCERRAALARDIDDHETARLADDWGARHRRLHGVLAAKARVLRDELELRTGDLDQMEAAFEDARARLADAPAESAPGPTSAGGSPDPGTDPFDFTVDPWAPPPPPAIDVDERLEELKRRMRDGG